MFLVEASALLPCSPDAVLSAVGSVESTLRWQVGVVGVRRARAGQPAGTLDMRYFALGERHTLNARVTRSEPPHHFAYQATGAAFTLDVSLDATPALGGTQVVYQLRLVTPPIAEDAERERRAATLRRLFVRRAPRDLARLESYVTRRGGAFVRPVA